MALSMKKLLLFTCMGLAVLYATAQNIVLTPATAELEGDPADIQEVIISFSNSGETQTMSWMRTINEIPDEWTSSVCDFNLCWAPNADEPGYYFDAPSDTTGNVYVKFDGRNYHDGAFDPIAGCGTVEVVFYSVLDSANYNAVGLFQAYLGVSSEDCKVSVTSPEFDNNFAVYPNPAVNNINVYASKSADIERVEIINIVGRSMASHTWATANGKMNLDITDLPQGVYFVRLIDARNKVVWTEKVSVME